MRKTVLSEWMARIHYKAAWFLNGPLEVLMSAYVMTHNMQAKQFRADSRPELGYRPSPHLHKQPAEESASMAPASERQETPPAAAAVSAVGDGAASAPFLQWQQLWLALVHSVCVCVCVCSAPCLFQQGEPGGPTAEPSHFFHGLTTLRGGKCRLTKSHWMWRGRVWYLILSKNYGASYNFLHILFHWGWKRPVVLRKKDQGWRKSTSQAHCDLFLRKDQTKFKCICFRST